MSKTCFFIGHRDAPDSLLPELIRQAERHVTEYGVREFTVGRYGRFDCLAAAPDFGDYGGPFCPFPVQSPATL